MTIIFKKLRKHIFTFIISLIALSTFSLGTPLSVSFAQNKQSASSGIVTIKITNTSDTAVKVLKWNTPLEKTLSANIFHIQNAKTVIPYIGRLIKRMKPSDDDYIIFEAGEERTLDIALPKYYKMTTKGEYKVTYNATFKLQTSSNKKASKKALKTVATHTTITFTPSQKKSAPAQKQPANFNQCNQSQIDILNAAHDEAIIISKNAYDTISAATPNTWGERYNTWFGKPDATRQSTVTSNFNKIYTALDTENIIFDCNCTDSHIAHVFPSQPYKVYLCTSFWSLNPTGTDSHAGTVVHELAHFTVIAGTDDHAYGHTNAKKLAISNPALAVANSDNHEYFAENTPYLSMDDPFATAQPIANIIGDLPQADSIDNAGDKDFFEFAVSKTGHYTFHTSGNLDTQGSLYDYNRTSLAYHDDINESSNRNFQLSHLLIKGKTYYLRITTYQEDTGGYTLHSTFMKIEKNDFNQNNIADILWRKNNVNHLWYMNADGTHTYKNIGTKSTTYTLVGTGDLNGDGITDILWKKGVNNYIWYMHEDGSHAYKQIDTKSYTMMGIADFNNDGIDDILWRKNNVNHLWYMNADGTHTYKNIGTKSTTYTLAKVADYNGDGITDILWRKGYNTYIWYMHQNGGHAYKQVDTKGAAYGVQ